MPTLRMPEKRSSPVDLTGPVDRPPRARSSGEKTSPCGGKPLVARGAAQEPDPSELLYYNSCVMRFEWDPRKAASNVKTHGVSFEEAQSAFDDEHGAYYPDALHADRFILIGYSRRRRLLYVVHAEVAIDFIRIISARKATKHEKAHYEND